MSYALATTEWASTVDPHNWLILVPHSEFEGCWQVRALDSVVQPEVHYLFHEFMGPQRSVSPARLADFQKAVEITGFEIAFLEDPTDALDAYAHLNDIPPFELASTLPNTINGFLPFQVQGFNALKDVSGVAMWSTGTGKTALASALFKYHLEAGTFDLGLFIVKGANKLNTQRTLLRFVGLDSLVIDGDKKLRESIYAHLRNVNDPTLAVTNYEKLRVDQSHFLPLFEDRRLLIVWDEMPTKLKSRNSQLYHAVCKLLYRTAPPAVGWDRQRPKELRQYMLSAAPIENDPEDWFNCVRLIDPRIYGTVKDFRDEYVSKYSFFDPNKPEAWHKLDKMGEKAAHIVHQVDKKDPDIAQQFPEIIEEPRYIDWSPDHRRIYDQLTHEADKLDMDEINILALISVLQMLCNAPEMVTNSAFVRGAWLDAYNEWAENPAGKPPPSKGSEAALRLAAAVGELKNDGHTKLDTLRWLVTEKHPQEKIAIFSAAADTLLPILEKYLIDWGVSYVKYAGTDKQRQAAHDTFKNDPSIRIFLSSDAGSDSINLEEASVVIHYDLPWKWSTFIQRQNRIHRVTSGFRTVRFYTLMMAFSVEDRKWEIITRKARYHQGVFKGTIADKSTSARMTKDDLRYILTGRL